MLSKTSNVKTEESNDFTLYQLKNILRATSRSQELCSEYKKACKNVC